MNNHKQKQYFKAMQQPKNKIISGKKKKQARDMKNKREIQKKNCFEIQNN